MSTATKPKHIGRNIARLRELRGMKQEALAIAMGVNQQTISIMLLIFSGLALLSKGASSP